LWRNAARIRSVNKLDAILDTSAIFCLLEDEPGADLVEQKIAAAEAGNVKLGASFVSLTEAFYITHRSQGKARAEEFVAVVKSWPMEIVYPDESLCLAAGEIKSTQSVSLGDAFVAATALLTSAVLVHKDPEFELLKGTISLQALPYKPSKKRGSR
jgi:predicted nucleic acid-binding protein